jgi:hypothetical protein
VFSQGTVYLLSGGHYYFVISDPSVDPESVIVVNMTTFRGFASEDASCIVAEGEHSAIRHKSWIKYEKAEVVSLRVLNQRYKVNAITEVFSEKCPPALVQRMIDGAAASNLTPKKVLLVLEKQGLFEANEYRNNDIRS